MILIKINKIGDKNCWWNDYLNKLFLVKDKDTSYEVIYLSDKNGNFLGNDQQESNIPKKYCKVEVNI